LILFDSERISEAMEDPKERLATPISTTELERRWSATREMMRDSKIDFLIMRNDEEFLGGYVKWFTDLPARHSYPISPRPTIPAAMMPNWPSRS
jgi:hypothetical protein